MLRHLKFCKRNDTGDISQMLISANPDSMSLRANWYESKKFRELLSKAILIHDLSFQFTEYTGIRAIFNYLYPEVDTVSRNTTKADVLKLYQRETTKIKCMLDVIPGRISLTSDLWSSVMSDGYMCLTAYFIDKNWNLQKRILNFCFMPPPHNGVALSERIFSLLSGWKIESWLFSLTLDIATSNDVSVETLGAQLNLKGLLPCNGEFFHLRCCCYILNLVVQDGLADIDKSIWKIRESVKYVKLSRSQVRKQKFLECVKLVSVGSKKGLRQDIVIRWNSTYLMLDSALVYHRAFQHLALSDSNFKTCPLTEEWERVEKVWKFLKYFYDATLAFSATKNPTSNLYFPCVFPCYLCLKTNTEGTYEYLKCMASKMWPKFQKYWYDFSIILAIACILNPRYKMTFVELCYKRAYGEDCLEIMVVRNKLQALFDEYNKLKSSQCTSSSSSKKGNERSSSQQDEDMEAEFENFKEFDNLKNEEFSISGHKFQLDLYLDEPKMTRTAKFDVLAFWKANQFRYPELAAMARDVLSILVSTVALESAFSVGGRVLDQYRSTLKPETVEAIICSKDWLFGSKAEKDDMTIAMDKITEDVIVLDLNANDESEIIDAACASNSIAFENAL